MGVSYRLISKTYDFLVGIYFRDNDRNPRKCLASCVRGDGKKVLDLCVGTASNSVALASMNERVEITGVDVSPEMIALAREKTGRLGLRNVRLEMMDATGLAFPDQSFDYVILSLLLHEIDEGTRRRILDEARRVVAPDGRILVLEWEEPRAFSRRLLFWLVKKLEPKGFADFLRLDLARYFAGHGLAIDAVHHCDYSKVLELRKAGVGVSR